MSDTNHPIEIRIGFLGADDIIQRLREDLAGLLESDPYAEHPWMLTLIDSPDLASAYPDLLLEADITAAEGSREGQAASGDDPTSRAD